MCTAVYFWCGFLSLLLQYFFSCCSDRHTHKHRTNPPNQPINQLTTQIHRFIDLYCAIMKLFGLQWRVMEGHSHTYTHFLAFCALWFIFSKYKSKLKYRERIHFYSMSFYWERVPMFSNNIFICFQIYLKCDLYVKK